MQEIFIQNSHVNTSVLACSFGSVNQEVIAVHSTRTHICTQTHLYISVEYKYVIILTNLGKF